jgi:hypothetical protein
MFPDAVLQNTRPTTMLAIAKVGCAMVWTRVSQIGESVSS